jgi:hypothetical protein
VGRRTLGASDQAPTWDDGDVDRFSVCRVMKR